MKKILKFPVLHKKPSLRKQSHGGSCGPNSMRHVINYYKGIDIPEESLINMSCCSYKTGAPIEGIIRIAENFDLGHKIKHNSSISDLINSINNDNLMMLLIQDWGNGHYVVGNGYDDKHEKFFYYDPFDGKIKNMNYDNLYKNWHGLDIFERNRFGIFFEN